MICTWKYELKLIRAPCSVLRVSMNRPSCSSCKQMVPPTCWKPSKAFKHSFQIYCMWPALSMDFTVRALQFLKFSCIVYSCIYNKPLSIYIWCIHNLFLQYRYLSCIKFWVKFLSLWISCSNDLLLKYRYLSYIFVIKKF